MAKGKISLAILKYNALKLRKTWQLPYKLVYFITSLDKDSSLEWIHYLTMQSEHYLRVKGYYKKYPDIEAEVNKIIEKDFKDFIARA